MSRQPGMASVVQQQLQRQQGRIHHSLPQSLLRAQLWPVKAKPKTSNTQKTMKMAKQPSTSPKLFII
jgi:hypothetical protein